MTLQFLDSIVVSIPRAYHYVTFVCSSTEDPGNGAPTPITLEDYTYISVDSESNAFATSPY